MSRYLVTSALPYANGEIHFGHVAGAYLPADVYVRYLRMAGHQVRYVCGGDEHGAAITIGAEQEGQPYGEYAKGWSDKIKHTFDCFGIEFDIWSGTSTCPQHPKFSQEFFRRLDENGYLEKRTTEQHYCEHDEMFLPDRYVLGTCPNCQHTPARGDECPNCGEWLDALKLIDPSCKTCGNSPVIRSTTHWYLDLPKLRDDHIGDWFAGQTWKSNVKAFVGQMLKDLRSRPITRDMSWGIPVPPEIAGDETGKVLYVWFDAPIGYISMTAELSEAMGEPEEWREWWQNPETQMVNFIGKDNIPFHAMVFPVDALGRQTGLRIASGRARERVLQLARCEVLDVRESNDPRWTVLRNVRRRSSPVLLDRIDAGELRQRVPLGRIPDHRERLAGRHDWKPRNARLAIHRQALRVQDPRDRGIDGSRTRRGDPHRVWRHRGPR